MSRYRTTPYQIATMPPGIPYIVANEAAERFSYYGMRAILVIFMTKHLVDVSGDPAPMSEADAKGWYHLFASAVYFFPILGALLADALLGKYRTILGLSLVYCAGHLALALDETRLGLAVGLSLIAIGSGGIKPCVSAHVGDQFGRRNEALLKRVFGWFYFAINLGALSSMLLTPWLLEHAGAHVAFGVPGALMALATWIFWRGRHVFVHIPPGGRAFVRETFSARGLGAMAKLLIIFAFVAMFWALFDQTGSAWVLQAERMDRDFLGMRWLSAQVQAVNPVMILVLIPVFSGARWLRWPGLYALSARLVEPTPLRRIGTGLLLTVVAFLIPAWIEWRLAAGESVSIGWQLLAYVVMTAAEVLVSVTCLEFAYTQAPNRMKSLVMATFFLSVSAGNVLVSAVNFLIQQDDGTVMLTETEYYLFWAGAMLVTALLFVPVARWYPERTHIQGDEDPAPPGARPSG